MTRRHPFLMSGLLMAGVTMTGACAAPDSRTTEQQAAAEAMARVDDDATRSDPAITTEIQARYYGDEHVRGRRIDVRVNDGMVALDGVVADASARTRAVSLAREVDGVREIDDRLEIADTVDTRRAAGRDDTPAADASGTASAADLGGRWITTKIQASFFADREIKARNIDVTTTDTGIVTLEGEVDSAETRERAGQIARATDGVRRVDNELRIVREDSAVARSGQAPAADVGDDTPDVASGDVAQPADGWVTMKIQSKYFLDGDVAGRRIDVDTQDGIVTLTGAVASEAERRQAVALARNTDGVRSVTDRLEVSAQADTRQGDDTTAERSAGDVVDDTWVATKIQSKYFLDADVKGRDVDVTARDGVVTLTGAVASQTARRTAEAIARDTDGVSRVVNRLEVAPGERPSEGADEDADTTDPTR